MFYKFKLAHNATEAAKNIYCVEIKATIDHSTINRWFKKFCSGYKNLDNQTRSGSPKTKNSKAMLHTIEANLASSTRRV